MIFRLQPGPVRATLSRATQAHNPIDKVLSSDKDL